ncbi:uncharacterized protein BO97DRAFT_216352 [Aspergillus homomorphus CBS 101889]|uniref:Uncharacterized protein n=1 Tax=Aspergillus homomorphus (strain CBS 101889) TaxID=1450537 RepID=A0A395I6S8_ASPHC|nr:hypothetical protein BO97DRAFT_216352 [Aspergillus homomorphus CBS 101889]RAL15566.1 hypothetical protein BO97DRAFT_216352 [Aspergillus homomorphus CBS 101889]
MRGILGTGTAAYLLRGVIGMSKTERRYIGRRGIGLLALVELVYEPVNQWMDGIWSWCFFSVDCTLLFFLLVIEVRNTDFLKFSVHIYTSYLVEMVVGCKTMDHESSCRQPCSANQPEISHWKGQHSK